MSGTGSDKPRGAAAGQTADPKAAPSPSDTPIMKQYQAAKARYPRHLLLFRIGDFYELFYEDAKTAARVLGLTLTSRQKGADAIPMAGVPYHTAEQYVARLLRQGFSVAVCDQTEDAAQAKGLVRRDITRVVTPGTVLEDNLLDARKANRLLAILPSDAAAPSPPSPLPTGARGARRFGVAVADLAAGSMYVQELDDEAALRSEFARLAPSECLVPEDPPLPQGQKAPSLLPDGMADGVALSRLKAAGFAAREAHARVIAHFSQNGRDKEKAAQLKALARDLPLAMAAAGALTGYIAETFAGGKVLLSPPVPFDPEKYLTLGDCSIRSLELVETLRNRSFEGSLLWAIDRTCSGAGGRVLREWLIRPLRELEPLRARHDAVAQLVEDAELRGTVRALLKGLADLERIAARLFSGRGSPRDLVALKDTLLLLPELHRLLDGGTGILAGLGAAPPNEGQEPAGGAGPLAAIRASLTGLDGIAQLIAAQLRDDCANVLNEGGLIKDGVDAELDRLRGIASGGKGWIASFQAAEAARTGISTLKVGYNRVFGYYIEITHANRHLVPKNYERRQTLTNAERYATPELKEHEAEVLGAEEKICALEQKLFIKLRDTVTESAARLHATGRALAELDALCSLAEVAHKRGHVRPQMSASGKLLLEQMRHPVLELTCDKGALVPNDVALEAPVSVTGRGGAGNGSAPQILLLTGPNMAGKSTYIRASALCVILAQMGAFVPAEKAEIGLVDRIFTRVGAADDVSGGRSTFMVEMTEVAEILAACSNRSLLVLDEVGRGTSTYDGVSLAWSLVEYLHQGPARPRTLFATHYHELCALEDELPRVKNAAALVKEWQGEITFLHRIVPGSSERSFGIHVARLAGVPAPVLERARAILQELEEEAEHRVDQLTDGGAQVGASGGLKAGARRGGKRRLKPTATDGQMELFEPDPEVLDPAIKVLLDELRAVDPNALTPVEALALLDKLVKRAKV
ncbi:MAG: DNA mismatch repair protein MutS [Planctomycetota bacterium]|nr:DNA mismatch repair protein MutS [Planctomycetota bacterium]